MRKQKTKRGIMGISLLTVMGITLLSPGARINEVKATSTPSDAEIEVNAASTPSDVEIEVNAASTLSDVELMNDAPTSSVAIDPTTFPDDVFRKWVERNCDSDSDGQLSEIERLLCDSIYVDNTEIASLKGIENFPDLKSLDCSHTNISSLDVSKNTKLTWLTCNYNNLSSLDVSNNTALKYLHCEKINLSSLDVSNNAELTDLNCSRNNLSSLDVSNNTKLTYLQCNLNSLSSLDVSNNTELTYLNFSNNNLSSLNVSNNAALIYLEFINNNLTSLDVSNNAALRVLHCTNNDISRLDVSKLQNLEGLYCSGNDLCSLDLSKNTKLNEFNNWQTVLVPMYKNGDKYYIDLSGLPLDFKKISIDEAYGGTVGATYNSTSGRINLSEPKEVGDTIWYLYETNGPALSNTKMRVHLNISEIRDITEPTTEEPTTEQPTTEQPTTEQPTTEQPTTEQPTTEQPTTEQPTTAQPPTITPAPTQTDNAKDVAPETGDSAPLYPVIFLLLVSFAGGVTLYIRRNQKY